MTAPLFAEEAEGGGSPSLGPGTTRPGVFGPIRGGQVFAAKSSGGGGAPTVQGASEVFLGDPTGVSVLGTDSNHEN